MKTNPLCLLILGLGVGCALQARADVKLPALISDHMVVQSDAAVSIWGWAEPAEAVSVTIGSQTLATRSDAQGGWSVRLAPLKAGGPLTLTVKGHNEVVVRDVLVGEVWLGSGQSNMGLPVRSARDFAHEQAVANFPSLRMFTVNHDTRTNELDDCRGGWQVCNSNTVGDFSAALYFFGREIHQRLNVPVGLIHSSWGGTPIQPWMALGVLTNYPGYPALLERKQQELAAWPAREQQLETDIKAWEIADAAAKAAHQPEPNKPWNPGPPDSGQYMPAQLYNAMIHPLIHYRIRGAIWYQGEANAGGGAAGAADYTDLQSRMMAGWRQDWGVGDFPFFYVQLPNWNNAGDHSGNSWAFFREGQANILKTTANSGMAVTIDIGDADNIHPTNKQEAGRRLALLALAQTYGQKVVWQGPECSTSLMVGAAIKVMFDHADGGLVAHGGVLKGFTIAGADRKWHEAAARLEGEAVLVSSAEVPQPVAVRYDWSNNPDGNLFGANGLPVAPFRTDRW